jgi:hypothetical protein
MLSRRIDAAGGASSTPGVGQFAEERFGRGGLARGLDYSPWGDD